MRSILVFLVVGTGGFVVDAGTTHLLIGQGLPPSVARVPAIILAIFFTWLANRKLTYRVTVPKSAEELTRYTLVALSLAVINYVAFLGILEFGVSPLPALILATSFQTLLGFQIYRTFVFRTERARR